MFKGDNSTKKCIFAKKIKKMSIGWNCFISLLIADAGVLLASRLGLSGWYPWIIGLFVFIICAVLLNIITFVQRRNKKKMHEQSEDEPSEHVASTVVRGEEKVKD